MTRRVAAGELALAIGIAALGLFLLLDAQSIKVAPIYARIGPRFFPMVVGIGLCAVGALLALQAARGGWRAPGDSASSAARTDWLALLFVSAGLLQQALLMKHVGFIPATAGLFYLVAMAFGSRRHLRDGAAAILLSVAVYLGFTIGLRLALPKGSLEALF